MVINDKLSNSFYIVFNIVELEYSREFKKNNLQIEQLSQKEVEKAKYVIKHINNYSHEFGIRMESYDDFKIIYFLGKYYFEIYQMKIILTIMIKLMLIRFPKNNLPIKFIKKALISVENEIFFDVFGEKGFFIALIALYDQAKMLEEYQKEELFENYVFTDSQEITL